MRNPLIAAGLAVAGILALPVVAQIPGMPDAARVKAGTYTVDAGHTQVAFTVTHLGFNPYFGLFGDATGSMTLDPAKPTAAKVEISFPIASIATSSAELNKHLLGADFFDAAKFPTATFKSTGATVAGTSARIAGMLTLKGVTKPVTLDASFVGAGAGPMNKKDTVGFKATTTLKRSDYGISYGVPMVSDDVELRISVAFERQG